MLAKSLRLWLRAEAVNQGHGADSRGCRSRHHGRGCGCRSGRCWQCSHRSRCCRRGYCRRDCGCRRGRCWCCSHRSRGCCRRGSRLGGNHGRIRGDGCGGRCLSGGECRRWHCGQSRGTRQHGRARAQHRGHGHGLNRVGLFSFSGPVVAVSAFQDNCRRRSAPRPWRHLARGCTDPSRLG